MLFQSSFKTRHAGAWFVSFPSAPEDQSLFHRDAFLDVDLNAVCRKDIQVYRNQAMNQESQNGCMSEVIPVPFSRAGRETPGKQCPVCYDNPGAKHIVPL
jgi:hypothetical protein